MADPANSVVVGEAMSAGGAWRPWVRHAARVLEPILYSVPLALWVTWFGPAFDDKGNVVEAIRSLSLRNGVLLGTVVVIVIMEIVRSKRTDRLRRSAQENALKSERSAQRVLLAVLENANVAVSKALRIDCNARYFPAVKDGHDLFLTQARDLHIETIKMPREYGFTRVPVDDPAFVSARSFCSKTPLYETLPEDHTETLYASDVSTMVEPRQRWVLSCPVLSINGTTGDLRPERNPHGVLVFYGVDEPRGRDADARIRDSLSTAQTAAEAFSYVLEMGDAADGLSQWPSTP